METKQPHRNLEWDPRSMTVQRVSTYSGLVYDGYSGMELICIQ